MSFKNAINLGKKVDAGDLFRAMQNSSYMKQRKYSILYANPYHEDKQKTSVKDGVTISKNTKGKITGYGLCYNHDDEMIYIHIRIMGAGQVDEFRYMIALGDEKQVEADLIELTKEIQNTL